MILVVPAVAVVERGGRRVVVLLAILLLVAVARDVLEHKGEVRIGLVVRPAIRVHVDAARVGDAAYPQIQIETLLIDVVRLDADIADAALDLVVDGGAVGIDRLAAILDAADDAAEHLRRFVGGAAACRASL